MAGPRVWYTSDSTRTVTFGDIGAVLTRFKGGVVADRTQSVSVGGKAVTVVNDVFWQYEVQLRGVTFPVSAATTARTNLSNLHSFLAHVARGGEFAFAVDYDRAYANALNGARTVSGTTLTLDSTTGMAVSDWLHIEDLTDPTKWEKTVIETIPDGTSVTIPACDWAYVDNSVVRYHEYFPKCVLMDEKAIFIERDAGKGAYWDLNFSFRTVR